MAVGDKSSFPEMDERVDSLCNDFTAYRCVVTNKDSEFTDSESVNAFVKWTIYNIADIQLHIEAIEKMLMAH